MDNLPKKLLFAVLIAFTAIAVFSFAGIYHNSLFSKCLEAVMASGPSCANHPAQLFHAKAFVSLSLAVLAAAAALILIKAAIPMELLTETETSALLPFARPIHYANQKQNQWFARLEKRDPSLN